jgi:hypothetical protein
MAGGLPAKGLSLSSLRRCEILLQMTNNVLFLVPVAMMFSFPPDFWWFADLGQPQGTSIFFPLNLCVNTDEHQMMMMMVRRSVKSKTKKQ